MLDLVVPLDDAGVAGRFAGAGAGLGVAPRRGGRGGEAAVALVLGRRRLVLAVDGAALARRLLLLVLVMVASAGRRVVEAGVGFVVQRGVDIGFLDGRIRVFGDDVPGVQQAGEL